MRGFEVTVVGTLILWWTFVPMTVTMPGELRWTRHTIDTGLDGAAGGKSLEANGDGDLDLAVGREQTGISRVSLDPGVAGPVTENGPQVGVGVARDVEDAVMGDIDGDGRADVVSSTGGR